VRPLRDRVHDVIFQHDAPIERAFDVAVIVAILASVVVVMLDSVASVAARWGPALLAAEWALTIVFTIEYLLRVWSTRDRTGYVTSFYGVVDLLSVLPTYLGLLFPAGRVLLVVRVLRVLRIFRILKLANYVKEGATLAAALRASRYKITVFVTTVLIVVTIVGSLMYVLEGPPSGFTSIPTSVYWAIVTLTTVGYGDIAPATPLGKALASALMVLGYGIIAVPTGIVTLELQRAAGRTAETRRCEGCGNARHDPDASFCKYCGTAL
jgi:voltage-gated potassium channel